MLMETRVLRRFANDALQASKAAAKLWYDTEEEKVALRILNRSKNRFLKVCYTLVGAHVASTQSLAKELAKMHIAAYDRYDRCWEIDDVIKISSHWLAIATAAHYMDSFLISDYDFAVMRNALAVDLKG